MIPFSPPRLDEITANAVKETLLSGWITTGPKTKLFEKELARYCGVDKVLCLNSWTNASELFLRWWGIGPGDEVIVPAYTYCATANIVVHLGARVVMVDVNEYGIMDPEKVREAITPNTKVIMPVDLGGLPADYESLLSLSNEERVMTIFKPGSEVQKLLGRILVFGDGAHSIGANYVDGSKSGAWADVTGFSFHAVKNLTTGEGGALAFNLPTSFDEEEIYRQLNIASLHGQTKDALSKNQPGAWKYDVLEPGYKCNMTDMQAAIGLVELERYERETLPRRKMLATRYNILLEKYGWAICPKWKMNDYESSYHLYLLRIDGFTEEQRDQLIHELGSREIASNVHYRPLPLLSYYKSEGYQAEDYPNAMDFYRNEITLPLYYDLSEEDQNIVVNNLAEIIESIR